MVTNVKYMVTNLAYVSFGVSNSNVKYLVITTYYYILLYCQSEVIVPKMDQLFWLVLLLSLNPRWNLKMMEHLLLAKVDFLLLNVKWLDCKHCRSN